MSKFYRIRVGGHLDSGWSEWFEGLRLTHEANGETVLSGPIVDEAALHGVLAKVRDLGLPLLSTGFSSPTSGNVAPSSRCKKPWLAVKLLSLT